MLKKTAIPSERWKLELFINDATPRSLLCLHNLRQACDKYLPADYQLKVVDISLDPAAAKKHQIIATPTLIKITPVPRRVMVGDFTNREQVRLAFCAPAGL